jgi:hypothetical protein
MLDHADPAVVGGLGVRQLARRIRGELVDVAEFDLLVLVGLVIDRGPVNDEGAIELCVSCVLASRGQLEIRVRRYRRLRRIDDLVGDVDHVASAVERQHLNDLDTVGRAGLQLHIEMIHAGRELAWAGQWFVDRSMVRHPRTEQTRLRDKRPLGRSQQCVVRRLRGIAVRFEGDLRNYAAGRVDLRRVEVGLDRDRRCSGWRDVARRRCRCGRRPGSGTGAVVLGDGTARSGDAAGLAVVDVGGRGGRCSRCQASHKNNAEKEKMTNRISRCVSIDGLARRATSCFARGGWECSRYRIVSARMIRVAARDPARGEPRASQRAMFFDRFARIVRTGRKESAVRAESGRNVY